MKNKLTSALTKTFYKSKLSIKKHSSEISMAVCVVVILRTYKKLFETDEFDETDELY